MIINTPTPTLPRKRGREQENEEPADRLPSLHMHIAENASRGLLPFGAGTDVP